MHREGEFANGRHVSTSPGQDLASLMVGEGFADFEPGQSA